MKIPRWVYGGAALAVLVTAGTNAMDKKLYGPEHLSRGQLQERRATRELEDRRMRDNMVDGIDADLADRNRAREVSRAIGRGLLR